MEVSSTQLHVRAIKSDDIPAIYSLIQEIYASTEMMSAAFEDKYPNEDALAREVAECEKARGSFFLILEANGVPAAYLTVKTQSAYKLAHTAYLNMGVSPKVRARSLGRKLIEAAFDHIERDRAIEILYLMVRADNTPAVQLYLNTGFENVAVLTRDTKYMGRYYDGILMRRFFI